MSRAATILAIRNAVDHAYGRAGAAIEGSPSAHRPSGSYASVDVIASSAAWGTMTRIIPDGDIFLENIDRIVEGVVSVNFYREGSHDMANKFITQLSSNLVIGMLFDAGVGITRVSEIRNLDTVVRGEIERRAQVDVYVNYKSIVSSSIDIIETVEISGGIE